MGNMLNWRPSRMSGSATLGQVLRRDKAKERLEERKVVREVVEDDSTKRDPYSNRTRIILWTVPLMRRGACE